MEHIYLLPSHWIIYHQKPAPWYRLRLSLLWKSTPILKKWLLLEAGVSKPTVRFCGAKQTTILSALTPMIMNLSRQLSERKSITSLGLHCLPLISVHLLKVKTILEITSYTSGHAVCRLSIAFGTEITSPWGADSEDETLMLISRFLPDCNELVLVSHGQWQRISL